ncbi:coiled-coil domain-containing protein 103-like isoform X2 [Zootermopsis nevadensis]|uniref:Coiled-coil domain-containing protein 103 n=2 Tax=Zootermopsis nevadensis TaxID=136037 RepID=A0A067R1P3_ZOONE|nr:coiled-coil domain-containing protein 103-like isoform X2 [Zootermopsis nevadensis]KDR16713.1 Coiled-coil domain-containing protein 103 [Zootermopsis nevadensis]
MDMEGEDDETINFIALETELHAAIEEDAKYWRENDAKLKAVEQRVATFDEFRDLVKASHLKPLDRTEKLNSLQPKRSSIWNSLAPRKKQGVEMETTQPCTLNMIQHGDSVPTTVEFVRRWRPLDICDRLLLLKRTGAQTVGQLVKSEIPVGILGEILQALLAFPSNTTDIVFVVRLLEALTEAKRFNLSLQFLSSVEKATCKQLMEKLNRSFQNRQQDLAEEGITEWTVLELKNKYKM